MSASRFWISTLWLAIGGAIGAAILWSPDSLQLSPWLWLGVLLFIAVLFDQSPNWWAPMSGPLYFCGAWAVGGLITWAWAQEPVDSWFYGRWSTGNVWLMAATLLMGLGVLLASSYLPFERAINPDEFHQRVNENPGQLWGGRPTETLVLLVMSFITLGGWFLLLRQPDFHDAQAIDKAVYALLFAWVTLWLGKLAGTLKARAAKARGKSLLSPNYDKALTEGKRWSGVNHTREPWELNQEERESRESNGRQSR